MSQAAAPAPTPTATSDFSYEPPQSEATPDEAAAFDQSLKDIVSEIEDEFAPKFTEEELAGDPDEGGEAAVVTPAPEVEEPEDPAVARGMDRLIQREVALQAREADIKGREARVTALEAEVATLRGQVPAQDLLSQLDVNPHAAFKALGIDPKAAVRLMIAEQLQADGQPVPEELQKFVAQSAGDRRIRALEAKLAQKEAAEAQAVYFNTIATGAREYVNTVGGKKDMPTLAEIATRNPEQVHREIMEEIVKDAQARAASDPNGEPLAYEAAARRVEARLTGYKSLFGPAPSTTPATKQAPTGNKAPPSQTKPPARPLKPWESGQDPYAQAIIEAEREFHRQEAARKARR